MEVLDIGKAAEVVTRAATDTAGVPVLSDTTIQVINDYKNLSKTMNDFHKMFAPVQPQQNTGLRGILDEEIVGQIKQGLRERINVSNLFAPVQPRSSILQDGMRTIQSLAEHPESPISRLIGDTLNNVANAYNGYRNKDGNNGNNNNNSHRTQEDIYKMILEFSPDNIEHLAQYTQIIRQNPDNTQTSSVDDIRRLLINDQNIIRKKFGIPDENQQQEQQQLQQQQQQQPQSKDINRQLMRQYENQPQQQSSQGKSGDFFNNNSQQTPEEVILSLSPDDPSSIHTYAAIKGIAGVDATVIKKEMIKEQERLRKMMMQIDTKWSDKDATRTINNMQNDDAVHMTKEEFLADMQKESGSQVQQTQTENSEEYEKIMRVLEKQNNLIEFLTDKVVYLESKFPIQETEEEVVKDVSSDMVVSENNKIIPENNNTNVEKTTEETIDDIKIDDVITEHTSDLNKETIDLLPKQEEIGMPPEMATDTASNSSLQLSEPISNNDSVQPKKRFIIKRKNQAQTKEKTKSEEI